MQGKILILITYELSFYSIIFDILIGMCHPSLLIIKKCSIIHKENFSIVIKLLKKRFENGFTEIIKIEWDFKGD
jgi:hypothetical protein